MADWVFLIRVAAGSIDALIATYAFARAFTFAGSNRYMRLTLAAAFFLLSYSSFELAARPIPLTDRTYLGWAVSAVSFFLWLAAVRADTRSPIKKGPRP